MKQKEYVFSEEMRLRPETALGIAVFQLVFLVPSFFLARMSGFNKTIIFIVWITAVVAFVLLPLLMRLKDRSARMARYAFFDDSVRIYIGRTTRSLKASDNVHIAVIDVTLEDKKEPIRKAFYMLWKEGTEIPGDLSRPLHVLDKYNIIVLPHNKKVCQKLCMLFGERKELNQENSQKNGSGYVFSDVERLKYYLGISSLPFCHFLVLAFIFFIIGNYQNGSSIVLPMIRLGLLYVLLLIVLVFSMAHKKYKFARYRFSDNTVVMLIGKENRIIHASDSFRVSSRSLLLGNRPPLREEKYIVLWKSNEPEPEDHINVYKLMKRYNAIVLPDTEEVHTQLEKSLGAHNTVCK